MKLNRLPINRQLVALHRWLGVGFCLFFFLWFATGAVLHFVGFPSLGDAERHRYSEAVDMAGIGIAPKQAVAQVIGAADMRLISVAGRPAYVVSAGANDPVLIAADDGSRLPSLTARQARSIAEKFGRNAAGEVEGPIGYDQWIVHQHFDHRRPFYRVRLLDAARTDLYVSAQTGEVLQKTQMGERVWNWCGAVMHWVYFTSLRKNWDAWNQVVWWLSLAALVTSAMGVWLGVVRYAGKPSGARTGISPFRGWMRWHHILGLFASVVVIGWIFSGWLSMDHGRIFSRGDASAEQISGMRGLSLAQIANSASLEKIRALGRASEVDFGSIDAHPVLTIFAGSDPDGRVDLLEEGSEANLLPGVPAPMIQAGLERLWPSLVAPAKADASDALYRLAESVPSDAFGYVIGGAADMRVYVDRQSGRILALMDQSRRSYAWLYYAMHTLNLPGLNNHPQLRTAVVLLLLGLGLAFSATGVVIGVLRLRRQFG